MGRVNNYNSSRFQHILGLKEINSDIVFSFKNYIAILMEVVCTKLHTCYGMRKRGLQTGNGRTMLAAVPHLSPHVHALDVSMFV